MIISHVKKFFFSAFMLWFRSIFVVMEISSVILPSWREYGLVLTTLTASRDENKLELYESGSA